MMKTAIVTLWDSMNYGAFFQAFSLYSFFERNGFNPCFLEDNKTSVPISIKTFFHIKMLKQSIYRYSLYKKYKKCWNSYRVFSSSMAFDICVFGSDEIWNVNNKSFIHSPLYIGKGIEFDTGLAYAPSANGASIKEFEKCYGIDSLKEIHYISVRDKITQKLVEDITSFNPKIVLDPTFLYGDFSKIAVLNNYKNYILIYGYSFSEEQKQFIKKFAREHGLKLISVGPYHNWCDCCYPASPFEFLGMVHNAKYVITSTFHGTVFSILFRKQFLVFPSNNLKIIEILSLFGLSSRGTIDPNQIESVLLTCIDYESVIDIVDKKRTESLDFLKKALGREVI